MCRTLLEIIKGTMSYLECFNDILYNKVDKKQEYYGTDSINLLYNIWKFVKRY